MSEFALPTGHMADIAKLSRMTGRRHHIGSVQEYASRRGYYG